MTKLVILVATHVAALAVGFAVGVYVLPILTAPAAPSVGEVASASSQATFSGQFRKDLEDSDFLHWGEGGVTIGPRSVTLTGSLAPRPDYKLYLSPEFVDPKRTLGA